MDVVDDGRKRGVILSCERCGKEFKRWIPGHIFCSRKCYLRVNRPGTGVLRTRTCKGCPGKFKAKNKHHLFCSPECYQSIRSVRQREARTKPKLNSCLDCGKPVERNNKKGPLPKTHDDCRRHYLSRLAREGREANPEIMKNIQERHEKLKKLIKTRTGCRKPNRHELKVVRVGIKTNDHELVRAGMSMIKKRHIAALVTAFCERSKELRIRRRFWIDLEDICHQGRMVGLTGNCLKISFDLWKRIIYRDGDISQDSMSRSWDRWKKKMREIGIVEMIEADDDTGVGRLDAVIDLEIVTPLIEMVLGSGNGDEDDDDDY